ncbi:MAG: serine threonine protein phosphatase, partial [Rhizobacter sp.]|nr:serine threonine protein phosphatase [Rhizobacter sp.]
MTQAASPWVLGARSETGFVRSVNEDRMGWTRTRFGDVFVVSDGMGGHRGGALAAEITVRVLQEQLANIPPGSERFSDHIHQAFQTANREVFSTRDPSDPETREMGATAVALVSDGARVMVAHVGDSRAYLWRRSHGLRQLTRDHTRVQSMMDAGLLTPEQAVVHPQASVLDRAMGHAATVSLDVTDWIELERGDMLMLCSDGLSGYVPDPAIETVLRADGDPQSTTDRLIDCALQAGGKDNVTVQLVRFAPAGRGALGRLLARPTASVPLSVLATLALAGAAGWQATASYRQTIGQLQAALGSQSAASAASAASGASAASAASSASSASSSASSAAAA